MDEDQNGASKVSETAKVKIDILPQPIRDGFVRLIEPLIEFFVKLDVNPNVFTTVGFALNAVAAAVFAFGHVHWGGALMLLGGVCDMMDGRVARGTGKVTRFGALYDSTLDRYSEILVFLGMAIYFLHAGKEWVVVAILIAMGGSVMVSYVRARAEGLGFECKIGIMQRAERVVYLGVSALLHEVLLIVAILIVAVLANITAIQRIHYIWAQENGRKSDTLPEGQSFDAD